MTAEELSAWCSSKNEPEFRCKQLLDWVYKKRAGSFDRMNNLPASTKDSLRNEFSIRDTIVENSTTSHDGTIKLLLQLFDNETIEMVIIRADDERITLCLSSQVGCPVRCNFCASGISGLTRNLSSGEIIEQLLIGIEKIGQLPDNIVFMGIGEGLLNFENLSTSLTLICGDEYIGIGARRVTISTSGFVPGIYRLADLGKQVNLAVSLHATDDETRAKLIPEKFRFPINEILNACEYYLKKTGRMVTIEYTLIKNINDSMENAFKLAEMAKSIHAKINLIPYNQTIDKYSRPNPEAITRFFGKLKSHNVHVTLRREKGNSNSAACGQLRAKQKVITPL